MPIAREGHRIDLAQPRGPQHDHGTHGPPGRATSISVGAPPLASDAGVRRMGCGDGRLLNDEGYRAIEGSSRLPLINYKVTRPPAQHVVADCAADHNRPPVSFVVVSPDMGNLTVPDHGTGRMTCAAARRRPPPGERARFRPLAPPVAVWAAVMGGRDVSGRPVRHRVVPAAHRPYGLVSAPRDRLAASERRLTML